MKLEAGAAFSQPSVISLIDAEAKVHLTLKTFF